MPVSETHRFLFGRTPWTLDKRLWVLCGSQTMDWFYHNLYHGCVDLRRTLEIWGFEHGMDLTVHIDWYGAIDFSGNPDPVEAARLFETCFGSGRALPFGQRRRRSPDAQAPSATEPQPQEGDGQSQAQQTATQASDAAGGVNQAIENVFTRLSNALRNQDTKTLLILDGLSEFLHGLEIDQQKTAGNLRRLIMRWSQNISQTNLVVFIETDKTGLMRFLPPELYTNVNFDEIRNIQDGEVKGALLRMERRHDFQLVGLDTISKALARNGSLRLAAQKVMRVLNQAQEGQRQVTLAKVLQLPPLNETAITEIKQEINELTGLKDLKIAILNIEQKARSLRQKLEDGESELPEETLHMIFYGSPGTGKTMVARLIARFFNALGLIERTDVREVTASTVMSPYQNETRQKMQQLLESCRGSALFIDEAHQFGDKQSMGPREAIQALVPMAWNYRNEMAIILAGYEDRMHEFFAMDEGLERRFPAHLRIRFANYTAEECLEIFEKALRKQGYRLSEGVSGRIRSLLRRRMARKSFGNAGGVLNLVSEILQNHASGSDSSGKIITMDDLPPLVHRDERVLEKARLELDQMLGLGPFKEKLEESLVAIEFDLEEAEGLEEGSGEIQVHPGNMLFIGPPGTGKTTVGRLMGDLLFGMGCIEKPKVVTVSRGNLIGDVQGASITKLKTVIEEVRDGVLFIDEAYALALDSHDTYGNEVVTELVRQITDPENSGTVFILAGYEDKIREFLQINEGLSRRFPVELPFPNFTPDDCVELARRRLVAGRYLWGYSVLEHIKALAEEEIAQKANHFGNAGWLGDTILDVALKKMKMRIRNNKIPKDSPDRRRLMIKDLPPLMQLTINPEADNPVFRKENTETDNYLSEQRKTS